MKSKHYDLILQWASDTTQTIWRRTPAITWSVTNNPSWSDFVEYYVGDKPPKETCKIGNIEFSVPESEAPSLNTEIYIACPHTVTGYIKSTWLASPAQIIALIGQSLHLTADGATNHSRALREMTRLAIQEVT